MNLPLALDSVPSDGTGYVFAAYLFFLLVVAVAIITVFPDLVMWLPRLAFPA
mgnify:CR=1 FL=1